MMSFPTTFLFGKGVGEVLMSPFLVETCQKIVGSDHDLLFFLDLKKIWFVNFTVENGGFKYYIWYQICFGRIYCSRK